MKRSTKHPISSAVGAILGKATGFLTLLFVTLRACDVIDWRWYWVLSPTLFSFLAASVFALILLIAATGER